MPDFMLAYHGGGGMPDSQEEIDRQMTAWGAWMEQHHGNFKDPGNPVGQSQTLTADSVTDNGGANPLTGYSIVTADTLEAAMEIAKGCPHLEEGSIEIAQIIDV